ncbi:ngg1 interacting factor 3 [Holotrichia oblita]|nr:ngg1 interacting factor 3 [Holotrichia oblita]
MVEKASGKYLPEILTKLEEFAPLSLAESWDNVGLLVDPLESVLIQNILLTNDLTEDVLEEAKKLNAGLIISYHPNIFQGMKTVSGKTWKERIVVNAIKNKIAIFSPHTSWDSALGGVNDWLAESLPQDPDTKTPIKENPVNPMCGPGRKFQLSNPISVDEAVKCIKQHLLLPHLRLALAKDSSQSSTIKTVALCAGSGSSVLAGVAADLYLTGEMLHHDILDATQKGIHVILCNHSDSERGFLRGFRDRLEIMLDGNVAVFVSQVDKDPLKTV